MPQNLPLGRSMVTLVLKHSAITRYSNISYVVQDDGLGEPMIDIANEVHTAYNAAGSLKSIIDNNVTLQSIKVRVGAVGDETLSDEFPFSTVGSASIGAVPPSVALLVRKKTNLPGRHGRGRFYIPHCLATTDVDEAGYIGAAKVASHQTAITTWFNQHTTLGRSMYLFHPDVPLGGAAPPGAVSPGGPPTLIVDLNVQQLIGTQRRRLGR